MALKQFVQKFALTSGLKKHAFSQSGYNKYGLFRDDCFRETPEVNEAIRRLPQKLYDQRMYRIIRAHQLLLTHTILPKNEWTTFEDDENNRYLKPYLEEVEHEVKERKEWEKNH